MTTRKTLTAALQLSARQQEFISGQSNQATPMHGNDHAVPGTEGERNAPDSARDSVKAHTSIRHKPDNNEESNPSLVQTPRLTEPLQMPEPFTGGGLSMANVLMPLTTRLQPRTAVALRRAGLQQRLDGKHPASVQEIVEIAVARWLKSHGFL